MMTKREADHTINFMYFAFNYTHKQLWDLFNALPDPGHFRTKFEGFAGQENGNGTKAFFRWFMDLSWDNQRTVVKTIDRTYEGINRDYQEYELEEEALR